MGEKNGGRIGKHKGSVSSASNSSVVGVADQSGKTHRKRHVSGEPARRGRPARVPLGELVDYCRTHSLRDAAKHFALSHSTISERLRDAGVSKMLTDTRKAQAALGEFGVASDGTIRRIGSALEQLDAIRGDTFTTAVGIMQRIKAGEFVFWRSASSR